MKKITGYKVKVKHDLGSLDCQIDKPLPYVVADVFEYLKREVCFGMKSVTVSIIKAKEPKK